MSRPGSPSGLSRSISASASSAEAVGPSLTRDRVADPAEELDVGAVEVAGALADPDQVGGDVVGRAGAAVDPRQGPLVLEQEPFVTRVELDPVELLGSAPHARMNASARSISPATRS